MSTYIAEIWIHGSYISGNADYYELFNVSGYKVPVELLTWMDEHNDEVEWLKGLPVETPLRVQFNAHWEDCTWVEHEYYRVGDMYWDLEIASWLSIGFSDDEEERINKAVEEIVSIFQ